MSKDKSVFESSKFESLLQRKEFEDAEKAFFDSRKCDDSKASFGLCGGSIETQTFGELKPKKEPRQIREETLDTAKTYVLKDRNSSYGEPEDNFRNIATLWKAYLEITYHEPITITPIDVAIMNILLKVARLSNNPSHGDSYIDVAGYAACAAGIALKE